MDTQTNPGRNTACGDERSWGENTGGGKRQRKFFSELVEQKSLRYKINSVGIESNQLEGGSRFKRVSLGEKERKRRFRYLEVT